MTKLTDTQLIVLSSAAKHDDGLATRPLNLHAAAAQKLASSLINKGLAREIRAKAEAPVWHENDDGRFALKISKAGREAIGVDDEEAEGAALPPTSAAVSKSTKASSKLAGTKAASQAPAGRELGGPICRSVMGRQRPSTIASIAGGRRAAIKVRLGSQAVGRLCPLSQFTAKKRSFCFRPL